MTQQCKTSLRRIVLLYVLLLNNRLLGLKWSSEAFSVLWWNHFSMIIIFLSKKVHIRHCAALLYLGLSLSKPHNCTLHTTYTRRCSFVDVSEQVVVQMQPPTAGIGGITDSDIWLSHKLRPMCSAKPLTEMLTSLRLGCS